MAIMVVWNLVIQLKEKKCSFLLFVSPETQSESFELFIPTLQHRRDSVQE